MKVSKVITYLEVSNVTANLKVSNVITLGNQQCRCILALVFWVTTFAFLSEVMIPVCHGP